jgi:hypothetical protein
VDVAELKEWQRRTARQIEGSSWLDEYDCERASAGERGSMVISIQFLWVKRYGERMTYTEVRLYIEGNAENLLKLKLNREKDALREVEHRQAEKEKQQALACAEASRRKTRVARVGLVLAVICLLGAFLAAFWAFRRKPVPRDGA